LWGKNRFSKINIISTYPVYLSGFHGGISPVKSASRQEIKH
jgi:hypothetical protein